MTKTVRSRFDHEVGEQVEGCVILEKRVVIPPDPVERRRGVFDYVVEAPPEPAKETRGRGVRKASAAPEKGSYTRATPEEANGGVIRRLPSR
jgi:hypothetical protein